MLALNGLCSALSRINWDFPSTGTQGRSIHTAHWFPGNFIPQIPSHLIQILSAPGDWVLDPFSGSGTTGIEAIRLGRNAICSDIVSACVFVGSSKLAAFRSPIEKGRKSGLLSKLAWIHLCETDAIGLNGEGADAELSYWYAGRTLAQLRFLWKLLEQYSGSDRAILELIFSDVLFSCASPGRSKTASGKVRRHHWGWVADNVRPNPPVEHDAITAFQSRLMELPDTRHPLPRSGVSSIVTRQDARALALRPSSVDLVVTSPPYVSVIDYTRANRLLYMWKRWALDKDRESEIGARYKRGRNTAQQQYLQNMRDCWKELHRVLRPGGFCAVVIGESRKFPETVDQTLSDLEMLMPKIWGPIPRVSTRRRVSDRQATEAVEFVAVFQKQ